MLHPLRVIQWTQQSWVIALNAAWIFRTINQHRSYDHNLLKETITAYIGLGSLLRRTIHPAVCTTHRQDFRWTCSQRTGKAEKLRCLGRTSRRCPGPRLKVMPLTPLGTHTRTMLNRADAFCECGKWSQPAASFPLCWGDVFSLSNRSGKNTLVWLFHGLKHQPSDFRNGNARVHFLSFLIFNMTLFYYSCLNVVKNRWDSREI